MRATHKRAAREAFIERDDIYSDDTFALSDDNFSEDEARYQPRSRSPDDTERMSSPKSAMDMHMVFGNPTKKSHHSVDYSNDEFAEKRVTIWNWREQRKLSGNSAPFKKNLQEYLRKHPDWEEYVGQDKDENGKKNFMPKKRRKDAKLEPPIKPEIVRKGIPGLRATSGMSLAADMGLMSSDAVARRRMADASTRQRAQAEADAAWRHAKEEAAKQKEQEEKEACRWREFSAIQHIIDHYNQGPAKSPFVGDNAMMNA